MAAIAAAAVAGFAFTVAWVASFLSSCAWQPNAVQNLHQLWTEKVFGQPIAEQILEGALQRRLSSPVSDKALLLVFHGPTQVGKSYSADHIAKSLVRSQGNYHTVSPYKFSLADPQSVHKSIRTIQQLVEEKLAACKHSVFIFEDAHHMAPGVLNALVDYVSRGADKVGKRPVNATGAVFIITTNLGQGVINSWAKARVQKYPQEGFPRTDPKGVVEDAEELQGLLFKWLTLSRTSENAFTGSELLEKGLVDQHVPFVPLTKESVKKCIEAELRVYRETAKEEGQLREFAWEGSVVDLLAGKSEYDGPFAEKGCAPMSVSSKVNLLVESPLLRLNRRDLESWKYRLHAANVTARVEGNKLRFDEEVEPEIVKPL